PLVGGFLTDYSLRLPFYVYAVSLIVAGTIASLFLSAARLRPPVDADAPGESGLVPNASESDGEVATTSLRQAWDHRAYRAAVAVNFAIGWAFFGVRMSLIPLFVTEGLDSSAVWIGIGFLCTSLAQVTFLVFAGRFVDRAGRRPAMLLGCLVA